MSPRANPASEFDAQLPAPQRDPLAFIVSFCFHTILILVILLATRKLHEAQEERRNHQPAQPQREVQMVYVPPPPVARPPTPSPGEKALRIDRSRLSSRDWMIRPLP